MLIKLDRSDGSSNQNSLFSHLTSDEQETVAGGAVTFRTEEKDGKVKIVRQDNEDLSSLLNPNLAGLSYLSCLPFPTL